MKLNKLFLAIAVPFMALLAACEPEIELVPQISTDKGVYSIGADGGSVEVKLLATEDWTATVSPATSLDDISGITVEPSSGSASGEPQTVKVNLGKNDGYNRAAVISFLGTRLAGAVTVNQEGAEGERLLSCTIAEFLNKPVDASVYYVLTGEIVNIANDLYSNFTIKDLDGDASVYIYGLAYKEDISNQKVSLLKNEGIAEGDIITIASTRGVFNTTIEGMNSYYISHKKSEKPMIKLGLESYTASAAGETFDLEVTSNKVTWKLTSDVDWLSFEPASGSATTTVKVTVAAGEGGEGTITLSADGLDSQTCQVVRASVVTLTCAEFNALEDGDRAYQIAGIVSGIVMDKDNPSKPNKYGNFYITDETGTVYVYGLLPEKGGKSGSDVITDKGIAEGDFITVTGPKGSYNGNPQGKNMWYESHIKHLSVAEFVALEDGDTPYVLTGKVANIVMDKNDSSKPNAYGNFDLVDDSGSVYVYGLYEDYTKSKDDRVKVFIDKGIKAGDTITLYGPKSTFNGKIEVNGSTYVLHVEGSGEEEFKWDYTPGAAYMADANLWKTNAAGNEKYFYYHCTGADWNGAETESAEVPFLTVNQSTYELNYADATASQWQNQLFIFPDEGHFIPLDAEKTYNLKLTVGASKKSPGFFKISRYVPAGPKHEGEVIWENGAFELDPAKPLVIENEISGVSCDNIILVMDFGGNPEGVKVFIKDITLSETGGETPPAPAPTTIAEIIAAIPSSAVGNDTAVEFEANLSSPAVVTYVNGNNAYMQDETGAILLYKKNHGLEAGNTVSGKLAVKAYWFSGIPEMVEIGSGFEKGSATVPAPKEITVADLLANFDANLLRLIVLKGVTVTDGIANGDRNGEIEQGGNKLAVYAQLKDKDLVLTEGETGDFVTIPAYHNTTKQVYLWDNSWFTKGGASGSVNIAIDGDMSDWAAVERSAEPDGLYKAFKVYNDSDNFYFYMATEPGSRLWSGGAYHYLYFDFDNDASTGAYTEHNSGDLPWEAYIYLYLFNNDPNNPQIFTSPEGDTKGMSMDNIKVAGIPGAELVEIEVSIPRANFNDQVKAGDVIRIGTYRSKDGGKVFLPNYIVL